MKRLACIAAAAFALGAAQAQEVSLQGAIDFHVHQAPDSVKRAIDADDLARLAKARGMRGLVMKNHWEPTASLAYLVRKMVPGIEIFGGVTQDIAVGGINLEAVKRMAATTGGYGRVVWLPTFDNDTPAKREKNLPRVPVSQDGRLLPSVIELIGWIGQQPQLVLETGHVSPEEGLMVIHEARARGVTHIVVTHAMDMGWTVPQCSRPRPRAHSWNSSITPPWARGRQRSSRPMPTPCARSAWRIASWRPIWAMCRPAPAIRWSRRASWIS